MITITYCNLQNGPEKIAQTLMHRHFATIWSRIKRFSPKSSEKITVYQSMQNLYQLIKHSLINSQHWIHVMSDVTLHVNMSPLTVEDRLLIGLCKLKKSWIVEKLIVEFPAKQWKLHKWKVEITWCLISYELSLLASLKG